MNEPLELCGDPACACALMAEFPDLNDAAGQADQQ